MILSRLKLSQLVISSLMKSEIEIMLSNSQYRQLQALKHQLPIVKAEQSQTENEKICLQQRLQMKEQQLAKAYIQIKQLSRHCVQMCKKVNQANQNEENRIQEFVNKQQQLLYELMISEKECEQLKRQLQEEKERGKKYELECKSFMLQIDQLRGQVLKKEQEMFQKRVSDKQVEDKLQFLEEEQTVLKQEINTLQQLNNNLRVDKELIIRQFHSYEQKIQQQQLLLQKYAQQLNGAYVKEQKLKLLGRNLLQNINFMKTKSNEQKEQRLILIQKEMDTIVQKEETFKSIIKNLEVKYNNQKTKSTQKEEQIIILIQKNSEFLLQRKSLNQQIKQIQLQISMYKDQLLKVKFLINNLLTTFLSQLQSKFSRLQQEIQKVQYKFTNTQNQARILHSQLIAKNIQLQQRYRQVTNNNLIICSRKIEAEYVWSIIFQYMTQINQKLQQQIHDYSDERRILSLQFKSLMKKIKQNFSSWSKNQRLVKRK